MQRANGETQPDVALDVLVQALDGEIPVHIHAARADEIMLAVRLIEEYGLHGSIGHAYEGQLVAARSCRRKIPVVTGPQLSGQRDGSQPTRNWWTSRGRWRVRASKSRS